MPDIIQGFGPQNVQLKFVDQGDGTHALLIATTGGGGGGAGADRELVVTTYRANTAGTGYSVGDILTLTQVLDVTSTPTHVSSIWRNQTTGVNISAPTAAHLEMAGVPGLTDAQLRATAVAVAPNITRGTGAVDANTQRVTLATDGPAVQAVGAQADAAAAADGTGNYSLIAGIKRGLLNWATLLARVPAAITPGLLPVDTLGTVGAARTVAMGSASANVALTTTVRRVSIHATVAGFYAIGTGAQTASSSTHYIGAGERLDLDVPANAQIAAIRASSDGTLYITELV